MSKNKTTYSKTIALIVDLVIVGILIAADQIIKHFVLLNLKGHDAHVLIENVLEFDYVENRGSAFGMLQNQKFFILFVGAIFMAVIVFLTVRLPLKKKFIPAHILFSMVVAGGIGNMIDRIRIDYVVDYISFVLIHFPVFNFADCCVVLGVLGLFILFLFVYKEKDLDFLKLKQNRYRDIE